jgi:acid stress-induced BolA-like protein IbaG/YrbA
MTREARTVSSTRLRRTAVVVAFAALALTGCSASQAGAASIVGGDTVTDAQVSDIANEVQSELAGISGVTYDEKAATVASLTSQTRHLILDAVAEKEGITVTQGQVDAFVQNIVDTQFSGKREALVQNLVSQSNVPESQVGRAARDQLIYDALIAKIASGAITDEAKAKAFTDYMTTFTAEIGVQVAPRFGTWNVFALGPVPNDLSFVPNPASSGSGRPITLPNPAS